MKNEKLEMRDSGVEWIGDIPSNWCVAPLKRFADVGNGQAITDEVAADDEGAIPVYGSGGVFKYTNQVLHSGDSVLFGRKGTLGKPMFVTGDFWTVDTMYYSTFKHDCSPKFVYYMLSAFDWEPYITRTAVPSMVASEVFALKFAFPDVSIQRAIAAYLDARCGEIEAAVVAARQSIEDYKALKKSLVFEAVTGKRKVSATLTQRTQSAQRGAKGCEPCRSVEDVERGSGNLDRINKIYRIESEMPAAATAKNAKGAQIRKDGDESLRSFVNSAFSASAPAGSQNPVNPVNPVEEPARPMRDSGVEWIGQVPEGWRVMPLRRLGSFANGISKGGEFFGKGYPFVSYSDVFKNDVLPFEVKGLVEADEEERQRYSVERGDVLFTRTSETVDEIGIAAACLKTIPEATFAGFLIRFRPNCNQLLPEFSRYYFRNKSVSEFFAKELCIVTRASLGQERLKSLPVMIPPLEEQRAIADYLDEKCGAIDALVAEKESLIADLEQYKKSLIFECVTGKREVA